MLSAAAGAVALVAAPGGAAAASVPFTFRRTGYAIRPVAPDLLPYAGPVVPIVDAGGQYDRNGVVLRGFNGKYYDHPVSQSQYSLARLDSYRQNKDPRYLARVRANADRLIAYSVLSRGARYYPYPFAFNLHGKPSAPMVAPWYSGMAQGLVLSLFIRLHEVTGEKKYRTAADDTFRSFFNLAKGRLPWVTEVEGGHLWFEEYPRSVDSDRALNGHIFAVFGLYDYYRLTDDPDAKLLMQGGMTTTIGRFPQFRNPNGISSYCRTHQVRSQNYHVVHIDQFNMLYRLTGDLHFAHASDLLLADFPATTGTLKVRLSSGTHLALRAGTDWIVTGEHQITIPTAHTADTIRRARLAGRPGIWIRVTSGPLSGYWIAEEPGRSFMPGMIEEVVYDPPRVLTFAPGRYQGFRYAKNGTVLGQHTGRVYAASHANATGRRLINGQLHYEVANGTWAGHHVPASDGITIR